VEPAQLCATQTVLAGHSSQAPEPLQSPVRPQVEAAWGGWQSPLGSDPAAASVHAAAPLHTSHDPHSVSGSVPFAKLTHVPSCPVTSQAWQVPLQAVAQQTPSTQIPLAHW
jgi:hypothetical protein